MEKVHNLWNTDGRFGIVQEFNPSNLHKVKNRKKKEFTCTALISSNLKKNTHKAVFRNVTLFPINTRPNMWRVGFLGQGLFWISPEEKGGPSYTETPFSA